ncbi:GNAT family N-acetyltransferase [Candidatus Poribacteria bacterium]|nr:GNAT family N-acetyltransferase [Candidatus Poribacteria bacterium]
MIVKMIEDHIERVIDIHIECFKDSFLTSLDRDVLSSMYNNYISSELGCAYVYIIHETILGFIVGTVNPSLYYNQLLKKRGFRFLWLTLKRVIRNPQILKEIAKKDFSGFFRPNESQESYRRASLDSIAVKPEYWGTGIAQKLTEVFLTDLKKRGVSELYLGVTAANIRAKRFYEKMGFKNIRTNVDNYGKESNIYKLTISG